MSPELLTAIVIVAGVIVYVAAKVRHYAKRSREQWQQVDKSKLKAWEDDDDWK